MGYPVYLRIILKYKTDNFFIQNFFNNKTAIEQLCSDGTHCTKIAGQHFGIVG